jgi:hypothetical protein
VIVMRIFPRRHRVLWIVVAVLGISAWGSWLAESGRTIDYGSGFASNPSASSATPTAGGSRASRAPSAGMTGPSTGQDPLATGIQRPGLVVAGPPRSGGDDSGTTAASTASRSVLAGVTDPLVFARALAGVVLSYGPGDWPDGTADVVLAVAALPPIGSPQELAADLKRFTPDSALDSDGATVTFTADSAIPSAWAASRLAELGLPAGSFVIDVTGTQIIAVPGHDPVSVAVTLGVSGACPPALMQCEVDRIFPRTVAQELGL